jgi:hypothetical protein
MKRFLILTITLFFGTISMASSASTITWKAAANGNWSVGSNWSGGVAPGPGDFVIFSASSTKNVAIDANVDVAGISITSAYTGTITQNSGISMNVGSAGFAQAGGIFRGSSGITANDIMRVDGALTLLSSSTFISPASSLIVAASATFSNTFQQGTGTVAFVSSSTDVTVTGSTTFYHLQFGIGADDHIFTIPTGTVLTAQNSFFTDTNYTTLIFLGGGQIIVQGNIDPGYHAQFATGTVLFSLSGSSNQLIGDDTLSANGPDNDILLLPNLTINKSGGTVSLAGTIMLMGNWINNSSSSVTMNPGTSTVIFGQRGITAGAVNLYATISGSSTFNNLTISANGTGQFIPDDEVTIATNTIVTVQGDFFPDTNYSWIRYLGGGQINIQGNIISGYHPSYATGTASFVITGTSTQILGSDLLGAGPLADYLVLPNLTLNKTGGSLTLNGQIDVLGNWTNAMAASVTLYPGTSTMYFGPTGSLYGYQPFPDIPNITLTGSSTFYNLIFGGQGGIDNAYFTIATGTTITAQGYFFPETNYTTIHYFGGGQVFAQGNIEAGYHSFYASGTASIVVNGTGTQILGSDLLSQGGDVDVLNLPNLTVSKTAGVAYGANSITIADFLNVNSGELSFATGSVIQTIEIDGTVTVYPGAVLSDYANVSSTILLGANLINNGLVFFDGNGLSCTPVLPNYVMLQSTDGTRRTWSGTGREIMRFVQVGDQGGAKAISVLNGTDLGNNSGSWTFVTGPVPQLIQSSTNSGGAGTTQLVLPAFGFKPRSGDLILVAVSSRNQSISAPTDNASNSYQLVATSTVSSYSLGLYYAKNIAATSSLIVTARGAGGVNPFLSASAFEYTGMAPSSVYDTYSAHTDSSGAATALTSFSATGQWSHELYFGAATLSASTTAISGSGWTPQVGVTNNNTTQDLYVEDIASSSLLTIAATWTSATSTSYADILGIFRSPYLVGYAATGTLDSATFDTKVSGGVQINSFTWQGATPSNSSVKFQFAVSNASSGPWNFEGPDGTANTYFSGNAGVPINVLSTSNGYVLFNGYRYFRYRVTLFADSGFAFTPTVSQVVVNWSP